MNRRSQVGEVARTAFCSSVAELVKADAALRLQPDAQAVHHARVAVRRLRSDVRTFRALLDAAWVDDLRERMRWLQDGFSAARDADVLLERARRDAGAILAPDERALDDGLAPLREARAAAYQRLAANLRDDRYAALLCELHAAADRLPFTARAEEPAGALAAQIIAGAWSTLRKRVRARTRPPADHELHRIRIAAKRLRYASEAFIPVVGRRARRLARSAGRLQATLGEQHDAAGAVARMRALADDAQRAFLAGELAAVAAIAARAGRRAWRGAWRETRARYRRLRRALRE